MEHSIAIIGLPNSGKTALLTALCSRHKHTPLNKETFDFEHEKCEFFKTGDWSNWTATDPAKKPENLQWSVQYNNSEYILNSKDFAGEIWNFINTYGSENSENTQQGDCYNLEEYITTASSIIVCVDLPDLINNNNQDQKWFPIAVKIFLQEKKYSFKRVSIVFTKYDSVKDYIEKKYGSFEEFFQKYFAQYFEYEQCIPISVATFKLDLNHETPLMAPVPGSESIGLDELEECMYDNIKSTAMKRWRDKHKKYFVIAGILLLCYFWKDKGNFLSALSNLVPAVIVCYFGIKIAIKIIKKYKSLPVSLILGIVLFSNFYVYGYETITAKIKELERKKEEIVAGRRIWPYIIWGMPKIIAEQKRAAIDKKINELKKRKSEKEEKQKHEEEKLLSADYRISKITIKDDPNANGTQDIYLKINGKKICEAQIDTLNFSISRDNFGSDIKFNRNNPLTIEVWDEDPGPDDHKFNIKLELNDIRNTKPSENGIFSKSGRYGRHSWTVEWERCE